MIDDFNRTMDNESNLSVSSPVSCWGPAAPPLHNSKELYYLSSVSSQIRILRFIEC